MTVSSLITSKQYASNGVTLQYAFPNKIFAATDLVVTLIDLVGTQYLFVNFANAETGLSYNVQGVDVDTGCTVVFSGAQTFGWTVDIRTVTADTQSTSIKNQGQFLPELHEEAFDRATRQIQDLLRLSYTFAVHAPDIEATAWPALPPAKTRANNYLFFNALGLPTVTPATPSNSTYIAGNVLLWGADPTGVSDSTTAIQNAISANTVVYVPAGTYLCGGLVIPSTSGFVMYGDGTASILKQKNDGNPLISWNQSSIVYTEGYIERLAFKGTNGTNHTINTSGVGGITLQDLYFTDTPVGFSSIYCNGAAATYVHDQRLRNIQIYTNTAGHSGIRMGPLQSDSDIDGFIMNGNFVTSYCLYLDSGAQTITLANSHPYNAAINVIYGAGSNGSCYIDSCTVDNAHGDLCVFTGATNLMMTQVHFEAINATKNGLTLTNCAATSLFNCEWDAAVNSGFAVNETGSSNQTFVMGGNIGTLANYAAGPFNLIGALSWVRGIAGYNPLGKVWSLVGCTTSAQAQNTTQYLGVNGGQSTSNATNYYIQDPSLVNSFRIAVGTTPAAGQTFTFTLKNGAGTSLGVVTISNGSFAGNATVNTSITQDNVLYIQSDFSATSGSSIIRWAIELTA